MLGPFVNILTVADRYFRHKRENFLQPIQMQLSKTPKPFFEFFIAFPNFTSNFKLKKKKKNPDKPQSLSVSEIIESDKRVYSNV